MIGLKRGTVKLSPYHAKWPQEFEKKKKNLQKIIGDLVIVIEHCGSTAIPGMIAKPIIDIIVGINVLSAGRQITTLMKDAGYDFPKLGNHTKRKFFFAKGPEEKRTHYIHVVRYQGREWEKTIFFRDYLQSHPAAAQRYTKLKIKLAKKYPKDRAEYTKAKAVYIKTILQKNNTS